MNVFLCLDVGGTEIKAAPVDENGALVQPIVYFPAKADGKAEKILAHFSEIFGKIRPAGNEILKICLAFPGPFDYENGVCLLRGLSKFDRLYGYDLRRAFAQATGIRPQQICFANDAVAFALGEMRYGSAKGAKRALFVCIGTGCGSAFGVDGSLATPGMDGVPESGYIYDAPFLEGCVDDYISRRGLLAFTKQMLGEELDGKALAQRTDAAARACFLTFGERLRDALLPHLKRFQPEVLCLGGQITKSASLFLPPVEELCREMKIRLYVTEDTSVRTLQGLTCI